MNFIYKIFSILIDYPNNDLKCNINYVSFIINNNKLFNKNYILLLNLFIFKLFDLKILKIQELYVTFFDRKKDFSLYIFEHIYSLSRNRGMAIVDINNIYKANNLLLIRKDLLPDYIPMFFEYLYFVNIKKSKIILGEIMDILFILKKKLKLCNNFYYIIFFLLEYISKIKSNISIINKVFSSNFNNFIFNKIFVLFKLF